MAILTRGERFKGARLDYNTHGKQTMDEVAAATGVSKSLIQALEDDENSRSVGYDKVAKLASYYGVSAHWLLELTEDYHILPTAADELGLSAETINAIKNCRNINFYDDAMEGMNLLITKGSLLYLASRINRFCKSVSQNIELSYLYEAINTDSDDSKFQRFKDEIVAEQALKDAFASQHPEYVDNFDVRVGTRYVDTFRRDLEDEFQELLRKVSNYNDFIALQYEITNLMG